MKDARVNPLTAAHGHRNKIGVADPYDLKIPVVRVIRSAYATRSPGSRRRGSAADIPVSQLSNSIGDRVALSRNRGSNN